MVVSIVAHSSCILGKEHDNVSVLQGCILSCHACCAFCTFYQVQNNCTVQACICEYNEADGSVVEKCEHVCLQR